MTAATGWRQPPVIPMSDVVTVENEALLCWPYDPAYAEQVCAKLGLGLTYRVGLGEPVGLRFPAQGRLSVVDGLPGRRTMALELGPQALEMLHLGGRPADTPLPDAVSSYPFDGLDLYRGVEERTDASGQVSWMGRITPLSVRILFSTDSPTVEATWRAAIGELIASGGVKRRGPAAYDTRATATGIALEPIPAGKPAEQHYVEEWWNGRSIDPFYLVAAADEAALGDLVGGDEVTLHAQVRGGSGRWYGCNVGFVLRALGVAGDPADAGNDNAYLAMAGGSGSTADPTALALVSAGVDVTAVDEVAPPSADQLIVLSGGSRSSVLLRPRPGELVPATLFSFATADDITVFGRRLVTEALELRLWQPTLTSTELAALREEVKARKGTGVHVPVPPDAATPILTSEYGRLATRLPEKLNREVFFDLIEAHCCYDGRRARPATGTPGVSVSTSGSAQQVVVNLNRTAELRPEHPRWQKATGAQLRRLFPVLLEARFPTAGSAGPAFLIGQDEIDCVRQEYAFHLRWTPDTFPAHFYQTYDDVWDLKKRKDCIHPNNATDWYHVSSVDKDHPHRLPGMGKEPLFSVPSRREIRPVAYRQRGAGVFAEQLPDSLANGILRYRHTRLVYNYRYLTGEVVGVPMAATIKLIRTLLDALDKGDTTRPVGLSECSYRVVREMHGLAAAEQTTTVKKFLRARAQQERALELIEPPALDLENLLRTNSDWRPPEHNESVSVTPISNHQLGEAMDLTVLTTVPPHTPAAPHNPLAMLALHDTAQALIGLLRELLMENGSREYLVSRLDTTKLDHEVRATPSPKGGYQYTLVKSPTETQPIEKVRPVPGEVITPSTDVDLALIQAFHTAYSVHRGSPEQLVEWPTPPPTLLDVYIFALCDASHVHFTWKRDKGES